VVITDIEPDRLAPLAPPAPLKYIDSRPTKMHGLRSVLGVGKTKCLGVEIDVLPFEPHDFTEPAAEARVGTPYRTGLM
jgi:hypothetical protein